MKLIFILTAPPNARKFSPTMGRKEKPIDERLVNVGCKLTPSVLEEVQQYAAERDWRVSQAARRLIEKGLEVERSKRKKAA